LTRDQSERRSKLKEIRSEETVDEYTFTGMATSPKEMVKEAMDRAEVAIPQRSRKLPVGSIWRHSYKRP
jgi:hypothetical protein